MAHKHLARSFDESELADDESYAYSRYHAAQRKRSWLWRLRWGLLAAVVVAGVIAAVRWVRLTAVDDALAARGDEQAAEELAARDLAEPFYLLLVEPASKPGEVSAVLPPETIELVRVDPQAKKLVLIAIKGATAFDMDEHGTQKIEQAYVLGGTSYLVSVVSRFAGVPVAHYAEGDLDALAAIVHELLGGSELSELSIIERLPEAVATDLSARDAQTLAHELRGLDFTADVSQTENPTEPAHVAGVDWEVSLAQDWRNLMQRIDKGLGPGDAGAGSASAGDAQEGSSEGSASVSAEVEAPLDLTGSVLVLNGSGVVGLAAQAAETLAHVGYDATYGDTTNAYLTSYVLYDDPANLKKAESVATTLGGNFEISANETGHALEADIVVILGANRTSL